MDKKRQDALEGVRDGIPICLGYLAVSFSLGILAVSKGLSVRIAVLMSALNLTSAGQVAGISVIHAGGGLLEIVLTQLVINARYSLMSLSLTQRLSPSFTVPHRLAAGYGITDEIFAISSTRPVDVTPFYMYGLISVSAFGWIAGTWLGAVAGNVLPDILKNSLMIAIYGMFIAIVLPPARSSRGIAFAAVAAVALSCVLRAIPFFSFVSEGTSVIVCAVIACTAASLLFPAPKEVSE